MLKQQFANKAVAQAEMSGSPATASILETLNATRATAKERHAEMERKIRQVEQTDLSSLQTSKICFGAIDPNTVSPMQEMCSDEKDTASAPLPKQGHPA